jgi:hypothetical protein
MMALGFLLGPDSFPGREELIPKDGSLAEVALRFVTITLVAPIGEELVFRGALQPWLRRALPAGPALALCAFVFAVAHLRYGVGMTVILLIAGVLGWAREMSGSLYVPVLFHVTLNALGVWLAFG